MRSNDAGTSSHLLAVRVKELEERLSRLHVSLICAFNQMLDLKDLSTGVHSTRLAEWGVRVGQELGMDEACLHSLEVAAILHDIGKIGVPDAVLNKTGPLTQEEWVAMKKHPEFGWAIVRLFPELERASLFILHHHERIDGGGYPGGLRGDEIPLGSRVVAVIDAFDAMVSSRPYRPGLSVDEAIRRLIASKGTQFDAAVVDCFVRHALIEHQDVFAVTGTDTAIAV